MRLAADGCPWQLLRCLPAPPLAVAAVQEELAFRWLSASAAGGSSRRSVQAEPMLQAAMPVAPLSVCVDSWFILGAMIAHAPQVCSPTQPESNQSDSVQGSGAISLLIHCKQNQKMCYSSETVCSGPWLARRSVPKHGPKPPKDCAAVTLRRHVGAGRWQLTWPRLHADMEPLPPLTTLIQNGDPGQLGGCPALQQQSGADTLEDGIQRDSKMSMVQDYRPPTGFLLNPWPGGKQELGNTSSPTFVRLSYKARSTVVLKTGTEWEIMLRMDDNTLF
ncbi:hypothetical protein N1851_014051 [Merluccius polli]|uniref:Uncharacterized protein n=1 Tax=Merluccius polli TaxID=89951 RepID=A0AA47P3R1_MERPO|nr:hypothetical protein N1851_014051 [Merluccius polli]